LLNRLLHQQPLARTLMIINEFGDIGIDHLLVEHVKEDLVLLAGGCLCCQLRGDLYQRLEQLYLQRQAGSVPFFEQIVIETSGLADPAPILYTFFTDAFLRQHYRVDNLIVTVDALYIKQQLKQQVVTVK
jgi:G3E family GTPase